MTAIFSQIDFFRGGFCYMRQELDSSDTELFPEEMFGKAQQRNEERMVAIAESFAGQGARQGDPSGGIGNPMNNRYTVWQILRGLMV